MANTTFSGAVRSENGFEDITIAASTGAVTTNSTFSNNTSIGGTLAVTVRRQILLTFRHCLQAM